MGVPVWTCKVQILTRNVATRSVAWNTIRIWFSSFFTPSISTAAGVNAGSIPVSGVGRHAILVGEDVQKSRLIEGTVVRQL